MSYLRNRNRYRNKKCRERKIFKMRCDLWDLFHSEEFQAKFAKDYLAKSQERFEEMIKYFADVRDMNLGEGIKPTKDGD